MSPPAVSNTIQRKPIRPRPSSSVYISRTSQVFEPVLSGCNANGQRSPSTEFYWQPAKYNNNLTALPEASCPVLQDVPKVQRLSNRYLHEEKNIRESVLLLASIMPRDDDEESASSSYEEETVNHRPLTYLPALEQVYHRTLNHEDSPEEDAFPKSARRVSHNKALGILGLDVYRSHSPQEFPHEALLPPNQPQAAASAWNTPSLGTSSNRASYESTSTTDTDADELARGYHDLLTEVYHSDKQSAYSGSIDAKDSISTTLRLVPAPLFSQTKQKRDIGVRKMPHTPLSAPSLLQSRHESTDSDRFHVSLFKQQPQKPTLTLKMQSPRLPFIHEQKPFSATTSMFGSSSANMTSKLGSALDKAKESLASTLSSIAENLEASQEKSRSEKDERRRSKLKSSIQMVGPCDANATIVAERLKSVPLDVISSS